MTRRISQRSKSMVAPADLPKPDATVQRSEGTPRPDLFSAKGKEAPAKLTTPPLPTVAPIRLTEVGPSLEGQMLTRGGLAVEQAAVRARQIFYPGSGDGTELTFKLTSAISYALAERFAQGKIEGAVRAPLVFDPVKLENGRAHYFGEPDAEDGKLNDEVKVDRLSQPGRFSVQFSAAGLQIPQVFKNELQLRVFGKTEGERQANLEAALTQLGLPDLLAPADPASIEKWKRLSLLHAVDPVGEDTFRAQGLEAASLEQLDRALAAAGVTPERVAAAQRIEVFPGYQAWVDPTLGAQYRKAGVEMMISGVRSGELIADILAGPGIHSWRERMFKGRLNVGKTSIVNGSAFSDSRSGGADTAYVRLVTPKAGTDEESIQMNTFGGGGFLLASTGAPLERELSRSDWHSFRYDSYGNNISDFQVERGEVPREKRDGFREKYSKRFVGDPLIDRIDGRIPREDGQKVFLRNNESMFKVGIPAAAWTHVLVFSEQDARELKQALAARHVTQLNGRPIKEAIIVAHDFKDVFSQLAAQGS